VAERQELIAAQNPPLAVALFIYRGTYLIAGVYQMSRVLLCYVKKEPQWYFLDR